jgi:hypothetical protein
MMHFWHLPRITKEDVERRRKAERNLARLREINARAASVSAKNRMVRQKNHFTQAIFGGPRD